MNPLGRLKLDLMCRGVSLAEGVAPCFQTAGEPCVDLKEVSFSLAPGFFVTAPVGGEGPALSREDHRLVLSLPEGPRPVEPMPLPRFLQEHRAKPGATANVTLDGYCLNLYLRALNGQHHLNMKESEALGLVRAAFEEGAAEFVQLNMDYCEAPDRGVSLLVPLVQALKRNFRTFVSFRGFAPDSLTVLDRLYASGVDLLVLPLEGFSSAARLEEIMPPEHGHRALEYAAGVFPHGSVLTELVLAPERLDLLFNKIDLVTRKGVVPLLKLPAGGSAPLDYDRLREVAEHLEQAAARNRQSLKWLYPSSRFVSPLDVSFYTQPEDKARLGLKPIYKSTFGKTASEGFANLRRVLRVKNISDSYESAGL